jgi:hypothetical protein
LISATAWALYELCLTPAGLDMLLIVALHYIYDRLNENLRGRRALPCQCNGRLHLAESIFAKDKPLSTEAVSKGLYYRGNRAKLLPASDVISAPVRVLRRDRSSECASGNGRYGASRAG